MEEMNFEKEVKQAYKNKLKSEVFGLLREYERNREWESFLDTLLIKLMGYPERSRTINYYVIFFKLSSARYLSHKYFRKTILDIMNLIDRVEVQVDE